MLLFQAYSLHFQIHPVEKNSQLTPAIMIKQKQGGKHRWQNEHYSVFRLLSKTVSKLLIQGLPIEVQRNAGKLV